VDEKMENMIWIDSSVLINHYKEKNKTNTVFYSLVEKYEQLYISVVTEYEILIGARSETQVSYWKNVFSDFFILNYISAINEVAINTSLSLIPKGLNIEFKDLIIASTALYNKMPLATLNEKHFINIPGLQLITSPSLL
jgi:predicted nucleic acid-binding protein